MCNIFDLYLSLVRRGEEEEDWGDEGAGSVMAVGSRTSLSVGRQEGLLYQEEREKAEKHG